MTSVLVVSDDAHTRRLVTTILRHGGFDVIVARSARDGGNRLRRNRHCAVVVCDLSDESLVAVVADLRSRTDLPLLAVSNAADAWTEVAALDAGADDFVAAPFGADELLARLRAARRRFMRAVDEQPVVTHDFVVHVADRCWLAAGGSEVKLTSTEWRIVEVLLTHPGHLVMHADLLRRVWGEGAVEKTQYLRVYLASIRQKVEPDPAHPRYFLTAPGLGYRFSAAVVVSPS